MQAAEIAINGRFLSWACLFQAQHSRQSLKTNPIQVFTGESCARKMLEVVVGC